jgi:hypothetical protein
LVSGVIHTLLSHPSIPFDAGVEVVSSRPAIRPMALGRYQEIGSWLLQSRKKFKNRPVGPTIPPNEFSQSYRGSCGGLPPTMWPQSKHIAKRLYPFPASLPLSSHSENQKINFARDLQERLGILALLALPAPFRICKLQIPLAARETDPVSGHHLESIS